MVDAGYMVGFRSTICSISHEGVRTKLGKREGSLYHLIQDKVAPSIESNLPNHAHLGLPMNGTASDTLETWHRRLCHRTLVTTTVRYLSSEVSDLNFSKTEKISSKICMICALGR